MPGQFDVQFLAALHRNIQRKYGKVDSRNAWTVSPDLYSVWPCTSSITVELFANSMNESRVLEGYCSLDAEDSKFSASGSWMEVEESLEGEVAIHRFNQASLGMCSWLSRELCEKKSHIADAF